MKQYWKYPEADPTEWAKRRKAYDGHQTKEEGPEVLLLPLPFVMTALGVLLFIVIVAERN